MSVQHVVLFSFEPKLGLEDEERLLSSVRSWPEQIGGFEVLRIGRSFDTARTRGYDFLLMMVVPDEPSLRAYQNHPVHQEFAHWIVEKGGAVIAFDYHLDSSTEIPTGSSRMHD
jgi:hypothetical protein